MPANVLKSSPAHFPDKKLPNLLVSSCVHHNRQLIFILPPFAPAPRDVITSQTQSHWLFIRRRVSDTFAIAGQTAWKTKPNLPTKVADFLSPSDTVERGFDLSTKVNEETGLRAFFHSCISYKPLGRRASGVRGIPSVPFVGFDARDRSIPFW